MSAEDKPETKKPEARAALKAVAATYVHSLRAKDKLEFESLFASEASLLKSVAWKGILLVRPQEGYKRIRAGYVANFEELRKVELNIEWDSAILISVRETETVDESNISGLEIEFTYGRDALLIARMITGPLVREEAGWRFVGQLKAPVLP